MTCFIRKTALAVAAITAGLIAAGAQAAVSVGPTDLTSGLQWAYADSMTEGTAQGWRAATTADYTDLLSHAGMAVNMGTRDAWAFLAPTFGTPVDELNHARVGDVLTPNGLGNTALGFTAQRTLTNTGIGMTSPIDVHFAWLDGQQGGTMGALGHYVDRTPLPCDPGMVCAAVMLDAQRYVAGWGALDELATGDHSAVHNIEGQTPWSLALQQSVGATWGYYMVKTTAVPEPGTRLTMALGLAIVAGVSAGRRSRRTQR